MSGLFIMSGGIVIVLIALGAAAWRWGVDSRDGPDSPDSPEWQRRQEWFGRWRN